MRTPSISYALVQTAAVIFLAPLLGVASHEAPSPQDDLLARPARIGNRPLPTFSAFERALHVAGVPGGVALVEGCPEEAKVTVHPRGTTLREVLDGITSDDSHYVWRLYGGVVNLEPSNGPPPLLRTQLKVYESGDVTDAASAVTFLSSASEVANAAASLGLTQNVLGPGLGGMPKGPRPLPKRLGLQLHNVTLLDALNAIARTNTHGLWTYQETHCRSVNQFNLSFSQ